MSKTPIDEQIGTARAMIDLQNPRQAAILATLEFVRDHQEEIRYAVARKKAIAEAKGHRAVKNVLEVFPEARIEGVGEAD